MRAAKGRTPPPPPQAAFLVGRSPFVYAERWTLLPGAPPPNVRCPTCHDSKCGGFPTWLVTVSGNPNVARHRAPNHVRSKNMFIISIFAHFRFDQSGVAVVVRVMLHINARACLTSHGLILRADNKADVSLLVSQPCVRHVHATWWVTYGCALPRGSRGACTRHHYLIRGTC
jgi:hypothetical protein